MWACNSTMYIAPPLPRVTEIPNSSNAAIRHILARVPTTPAIARVTAELAGLGVRQ